LTQADMKKSYAAARAKNGALHISAAANAFIAFTRQCAQP